MNPSSSPEARKLARWMSWSFNCGVILLIAALGYWLYTLFSLFREFYKYNGLDLIFRPLFYLFANPFLWAALLLLMWHKHLRRKLEEAEPDAKKES